VRAEIGEAKLFKLPVRFAGPRDTDIEHRVDGQVVWCSTISYTDADVTWSRGH
jgi:hypothetical protein